MPDRILIVEDDELMRRALEKTLAAAGYAVEAAADGHAAIERIRNAPFDLIITDVRMPGIDGIEVVARVKAQLPTVKTVVITAYASEEAPVRAVNLGVDAYFPKPFEMKDLLAMVQQKLSERNLVAAVESRNLVALDRCRAVIRVLADLAPRDEARQRLGQAADGRDLLALFEGVVAAESAGEERMKPSGGTRSWKDLEGRVESLLALGSSYGVSGDAVVARKAFENALELLENQEGRLRDTARLHLAKLSLRLRAPDEALPLLREIAAHDAISPSLSLEARLLTSWAHLERGELQDATAALREAETLAQEIASPSDRFRYALFAAYMAFVKGEQERGVSILADMFPLTAQHDFKHLFLEEREIAGLVLLEALRLEILPEELRPVLFSLSLLQDHRITAWIEDLPEKERRRLLQVLKKPDREIDRLQMYVFGVFRVFRGPILIGEAEWRRKRAKGILAYLLLHQRVSSDKLADLFWPDTEGDKARQRLQLTIYYLRRILQPTLGEEDPSRHIVYDRNFYWFDRAHGAYCDLWDFRDRTRRAREHLSRGRVEEGLLELEEAVRVYRAPFFEDCDDDWCIEYRDLLTQEALEAPHTLLVRYEEAGAYEKAISAAQKILEFDRSREDAHLVIMRCCKALGKRDKGIRQFHLYKEWIRQDLDLHPSPQALALFESLQQ